MCFLLVTVIVSSVTIRERRCRRINATRSRKKLPRRAACRERETRSPSFTERTYRRKAGAARNVLTTTLLAYGREGLSGLIQSLRSLGQIGKLESIQEAGFRGQKRQPNRREDPFYCACSFCPRSCASSMSHSPTRLSSGEPPLEIRSR